MNASEGENIPFYAQDNVEGTLHRKYLLDNLNYSRLLDLQLTLSDRTSNLVQQYNFPVPLRCRKMSDTVFVAFVHPLSEPVRRFSSCTTDFSQQIAQVVLLLFLCVFLFLNCRIITIIHQPLSRPKQIRAGEYAVGRKIGLERVNT
jgi:hypothetical protein